MNRKSNDHLRTSDFTWDELANGLVGKNQERSYRDQIYNGQPLQSFSDFLNIALKYKVGIYPETKNPEDFNNWLKTENSVNFTFEDLVVQEFNNHEYSRNDYDLVVFWHSFSLDSILELKRLTTGPAGPPGPGVLADTDTYKNSKYTYTSSGPPKIENLTTLLNHNITGLSLNKNIFVEPKSDNSNHIQKINKNLAQEYKNMGFDDLHIYTFRSENQFLLFEFEQDFSLEVAFWLENFPEVTGYVTDFSKSFRNVFESFIEIDSSSGAESNVGKISFSSLFTLLCILWALK